MLGFRKKKMASLIADTIYENRNQLYRIAFAYTKNEQDALDVIQDTCEKAILKQAQLKDTAYVKTWLIRILINLAVDQNRVKGRYVFKEEKENQVVSEETPEFLFIEEETNETLYQAVDNLPSIYREIVVLRYFEVFKLEEIAHMTNMPLSTVKTRLYKALSLLKEALTEVKTYGK